MLSRILFSLLIISSTASTLYAAAFKKATVWDHREIKVCTLNISQFMKHWEPVENEFPMFISPRGAFETLLKEIKEKIGKDLISSNNTQRIERIKNIVDSSYSDNKTGIHFTDWQECPFEIDYWKEVIGDRKDYNAVIVSTQLDQEVMNEYSSLNPEMTPQKIKQKFTDMINIHFLAGKSEIGDISKTDPEKISVMTLEDITPSELTILHEFGHLSGLIHEHERSDAFAKDPFKDDPACIPVYSGEKHPLIFEGGYFNPEDLISAAYDPSSIMNYCQTSRIKTTNLSSSDSRELLNFFQNLPLK